MTGRRWRAARGPAVRWAGRGDTASVPSSWAGTPFKAIHVASLWQGLRALGQEARKGPSQPRPESQPPIFFSPPPRGSHCWWLAFSCAILVGRDPLQYRMVKFRTTQNENGQKFAVLYFDKILKRKGKNMDPNFERILARKNLALPIFLPPPVQPTACQPCGNIKIRNFATLYLNISSCSSNFHVGRDHRGIRTAQMSLVGDPKLEM